jgi:triosephosphate isomerase
MKIIIANWKMNHGFDAVDEWLDGFYNVYAKKITSEDPIDVVLCPQNILLDYIDSELIEDGFNFLEYLANKEGKSAEDFTAEEIERYVYKARPLRLGAQDCGIDEAGQFTGDVSANLLKEVNCEYVIIGHSERRKFHFETNEIVAKKIIQAQKNSINPVICVGESKDIRDLGQHFEFVKNQILTIPSIIYDKLIIAYEPIWAIGTGETASIQQIEEMTKFIHQICKEKFTNYAKKIFVLYGGSVNSSNSPDILKINEVNGLLVGKASLDIVEFTKILTGNLSSNENLSQPKNN